MRKILLIFIIALCLLNIFTLFRTTTSKVEKDSVIVKEERVRDSLNVINDTLTKQINNIHNTYEKTVDRIITQSADSDILFIKAYISRYSINETGLQEDSITIK